MRFLSYPHTRRTLGAMVPALGVDIAAAGGLGPAYRQMISGMRPIPAAPEGMSVSFYGSPWADHLIRARIFDNIFEGLEDTPEEQRAAWSRDLMAAVAQVRELPGLGETVELLVADVVLFSSKNKGGGSASHVPGLVSMSPGDAWTVDDFAESLVHEAVHLNTFVLDMAYRLYTRPAEALAAEECRVVSAVKVGQMRPLDKAFHSAVVAPPLMWMQSRRGETALVDALRVSLRDCTEGLLGKLDYFTPYGRLLVQELAEWTQTYDMGAVEESATDERYARYAIIARV